MPRANTPFEFLEKVNHIAHKIVVLGEYGVLCTFNATDLKPYFGDDHLENLRVNKKIEELDLGHPSSLNTQDTKVIEHLIKEIQLKQ